MFAFLLFGYLCQLANGNDEGFFWHITDMHWDPTYARDKAGLSCNPGSPPEGPYGKYGDFNCDPPWLLIEEAFSEMKDIRADVDFLIWTGDDTPHIWNNTVLHQDWVFEIINNQTQIINYTFPGTPVFSAIGNHDWSPKNQLPPSPDPFYNRIHQSWSQWLHCDEDDTFSGGAYFACPIRTGLRMVVLNTNLYYDSNVLTRDMHDPANQLQWFDDVMTAADKNGEKVIVIGHVPPGMFEKHPDKNWFYSFYNDALIAMLRKHAHVIGSMHFAHHHTDSFRLLRDADGDVVSSMLLGPALSPWETTLPGVMGGSGNNPSMRLLKYDRETGKILDIHQYWLNLTAANEREEAEWEIEYIATEYYDVDDVSTEALSNLADNLIKDDDLFSKYYRANGVIYDPDEEWDEEIRVVHYCSAVELNYRRYAECYNEHFVSAASAVKSTHFCLILILACLSYSEY